MIVIVNGAVVTGPPYSKLADEAPEQLPTLAGTKMAVTRPSQVVVASYCNQGDRVMKQAHVEASFVVDVENDVWRRCWWQQRRWR